MSSAFDDVMRGAMEASATSESAGDWRDEDGILRCGRCGQPKETRQEMPEALRAKFGDYRLLPILCGCELERQERERRDIEDAERRKAVDAARDACFPYPQLKACTLEADDRKNPGMTKVCQRFVERFHDFEERGAGLLFYGAVGGGKTFHAASIANGVIDQGDSALFTSLSTLGARMSANYGRDRLRVLEEICDHDLVVLDDLGIERSTDAMNENVYQIVNALYLSRTVVVFTTNVSPSSMMQETDPNRQRIYSRIFEMAQPVEVKGADRRRQVSEERAALYRGLVE